MGDLLINILLFLICLLVAAIFIGITYLILTIILGIASLPGNFLEKRPWHFPNVRFAIALMLSSALQIYFYLFHVAFIVHNAYAIIKPADPNGFLVWGFAFIMSVSPIIIIYKKDRDYEKLTDSKNSMTRAFGVTLIASVAGFFLFLFKPDLMNTFWSRALIDF